MPRRPGKMPPKGPGGTPAPDRKPAAPADDYWVKVGDLFKSGGMYDPAFLFGMIRAQHAMLKEKPWCHLCGAEVSGVYCEPYRAVLAAAPSEELRMSVVELVKATGKEWVSDAVDEIRRLKAAEKKT